MSGHPEICVRLFEESDLSGCLKLWAENTEWGEITEEDWRTWYQDTPHGPAIISVAVDRSGEILGQTCFTPVALQVGDRTYKGLRPSAPILMKSLRQSDLRSAEHPVIKLFLTGIEAAKTQGFELLYALPWRLWMPAFSWAGDYGFDFEQAEYSCVARKLADIEPIESNNLTCQSVSEFGSEYETLWQQARINLPIECASVRDPASLLFRNGAHLNIEVRQGEQLLGFISIKKETGLIADYLACDLKALGTVASSALHFIATEKADDVAPGRITALDTPPISSVLGELQFSPVRFKFAFFCFPLVDIPRSQIAPERWFLTGGE